MHRQTLRLLAALGDRDPQSTFKYELTKDIGMSYPHISARIKEFRKLKLVTIKHHGRHQLISLTKKGKQLSDASRVLRDFFEK